MVTRGSWADMLCVMDAVHDQLPDVIAGELVEHLNSLAPRRHQSGHSQLREMLGHRRLRLADAFCQLQDRLFTVEQEPEKANPGRVGQHAEDLDGQADFFLTRKIRSICAHTYMYLSLIHI